MKFDSTYIMYTCVCGKQVLHYLHYLHLFSPRCQFHPARIPAAAHAYVRRGQRDIRVGRCRYTHKTVRLYVSTIIRSRSAMAILPPLSYASHGNRPRKTRGRSIVCNLCRPFSRCACEHTHGANDPSRKPSPQEKGSQASASA